LARINDGDHQVGNVNVIAGDRDFSGRVDDRRIAAMVAPRLRTVLRNY
jgi:hypothetical protein